MDRTPVNAHVLSRKNFATHMPQGVVPRGGDARRACGVVVQERRAHDDVRRREREHVRDRLQERRAACLVIEERRRDQPRAERDFRAHALRLCTSAWIAVRRRRKTAHRFGIGHVFAEEREVGGHLLDDGRPALGHGEVGCVLHGCHRLCVAEQGRHVDQRWALRAAIRLSATIPKTTGMNVR